MWCWPLCLQVYYPVRHHLVQHMVSAMQRLGFTPSVTICELNIDPGPSCQISQRTELEFKLIHWVDLSSFLNVALWGPTGTLNVY